jgi:hypothetical protein
MAARLRNYRRQKYLGKKKSQAIQDSLARDPEVLPSQVFAVSSNASKMAEDLNS